jgi:hypothetical protein
LAANRRLAEILRCSMIISGSGCRRASFRSATVDVSHAHTGCRRDLVGLRWMRIVASCPTPNRNSSKRTRPISLDELHSKGWPSSRRPSVSSACSRRVIA